MKMTFQLTLFNGGSFPTPHFVVRGILLPLRSPIRHSGEDRNPEGRGLGNVVRSKTTRGEGLVPRRGLTST